jgi:hypothetical protein
MLFSDFLNLLPPAATDFDRPEAARVLIEVGVEFQHRTGQGQAVEALPHQSHRQPRCVDGTYVGLRDANEVQAKFVCEPEARFQKRNL